MMTIFFPTLRQYEIAQVIDTSYINNNEAKKSNKPKRKCDCDFVGCQGC